MAYYDAFETFGDRIAAREDNGQTATYEDLARFCDRLGKTLPVRTLVFCFCENTIGAMFGYLAFLKNRVVPLLLDNHIHRDLAEQLTAASRCMRIWLFFLPLQAVREARNWCGRATGTSRPMQNPLPNI